MRGLHWFRVDLRVQDNTALLQAAQACDELAAVFIITPGAWAEHGESPSKLALMMKQLQDIEEELRSRGIVLFCKTVESFKDIPAVLLKICNEHSIEALYFNKQYEFNEMRRDIDVVAHLTQNGIQCKEVDDALILAPGALLNQQGSYFKVFTPFKKAWWSTVLEAGAWIPSKDFKKKFSPWATGDKIPVQEFLEKSLVSLDPWVTGSAALANRMEQFFQCKVSSYHEQRDFPAIAGTSQLSPYFAIGALSPRQAIQSLIHCLDCDVDALIGTTGPGIWVSELIWREFYTHIMFHVPRVCYYKAYQTYTDTLPWRQDPELFAAWCEGRTGFPLVDAAMRQLVQTGWMHNRLRMVTAMFLSKTLFIDWRWGEAFFMKHLLDGNLAANNGGWQWSASTGTDAVPYFRIFNPTTQSERFDDSGEFIRRYCPELKSCSNKDIHAPWDAKKVLPGLQYPTPIVDYKAMRDYVIKIFKLRSSE